MIIRLLLVALLLAGPGQAYSTGANGAQAIGALEGGVLEGRALEDGARHARLWQSGWAAGYGLGAAFYLERANSTDEADVRYDSRISAFKSALALADVLINPPPHHQRWQALRRQSDGAPERDDMQGLIRTLAEHESRRTGWRARLGPLAVNAAAGLAIGIDDGRPRDGWRNFAGGMLVTELRILSEPRNAGNHLRQQNLRLGNHRLEYQWQWWLGGEQIGVLARFH